MPPAFDSTKQAAAFALLLLVLLAAPWLAHKTFLPRREETYSSQSIRHEVIPWVQKFIYSETNDIDVAFVGSSRMGHGIDTPYVQQKLDERLGRKSVVRSLYLREKGFDCLYSYTKDLLAHRRVKTLVFYDEFSGPTAVAIHQYAPRWYRFGNDGGVMPGLPLPDEAIYYFAAVIGMPRNFLELLTPNLPRDTNSTFTSFVFKEGGLGPDPETTLGCIFTPHSYFDPKTGTTFDDLHAPPYFPQSAATPADVRVFSPTTGSNFVFSSQTLPDFALYFARQFGSLAKKYGCRLVLLHLPMYADRTSPVITESRYWPDLLQTEVCMMGIPGERLFAGLSDRDIGRLYIDPVHLNENGQRYFTSTITPAILQFYERHPTY